MHRLIYTDPAIFQAELTNIWGAVWVYLGHESQLPNNNDFITAKLGLRPIILIRDAAGKIRALCSIDAPIVAPLSVERSAAMRTCSPARIMDGAS